MKSLFKKLNRYRLIYDRKDDEPYLERYYLFLKERKTFPFNIFIHKFLKSDPDDLHDHPWPFFTLILWGGYYEWIPKFDENHNLIGEERFWRGPGHIGRGSENNYHRVELKENTPAWTLFIPGRQKKDWGFLTHQNWKEFEYVNNDVYLGRMKHDN